MRRPLCRLCLLSLMLVSGCTGINSASVVSPTGEVGAACEQIPRWLQLHAELSRLSPDAARAALANRGNAATPTERYHNALLHQQLHSVEGWIQARDQFRSLRQDDALPLQQRQLAAVLEQYNQNRINANQSHRDQQQHSDALQQHLQTAEEEIEWLRQKIKALTAVEATISTRRER